MTEPHRTYGQQQDVEAHAPYIKVWFALLVFTVAEYFYAMWMAKGSFVFLVLGLLTMAVIKAALVAIYFMHLKFEGRWVYLMLIPAGILACVLVLALYPDIAMQAAGPEAGAEEEEAAAAPLYPGAPA